MRSSTLCIVWPTSPNSATGQKSLINRASDVPPDVLSSGSKPVMSLTTRDAGRGQECVARNLDIERVLAADGIALIVQPLGQAGAGMEIVVADIEPGGRLGGNDVGGRVARIDGCQLQVRRLKMIRAVIQGCR